MKPTTLQYPASTSKAGYRQLKQTMLRMGHLRNALIRHRDSARSSHRHAFNLNLQNAQLTDLHRHDIQEVRPPTPGARRPRGQQVLPHPLQASRRRPAQHRKSTPAPHARGIRAQRRAPQSEAERLRHHPDQGTPHHQAPDRRADPQRRAATRDQDHAQAAPAGRVAGISAEAQRPRCTGKAVGGHRPQA